MSDTATLERPEQKVTVEDAGPARKKITIELPESRIKDKLEEQYNTLRSDAAVPGFRRGRAPRRLIEKQFGKALRNDVKGQLISEAYSQAIEDEKLDVIGEPEMKDHDKVELPESGSWTLVLEVEVAPTVELPEFGSIEVKKRKAEVTDEDVEKEIERYRERMGQMKPVEGADSQISEKDYVQADVHIYAGENVAAKPHSDEEGAPEPLFHAHGQFTLVHGKEHDYKGHIAGILIEDLGKRLVGKSVGHEERISMTGPQGHEDERIKGQPITIVLNVTGIHRMEPAPAEKVAEQLGIEGVEQMKTTLKPVLEQRATQRQQSDMHRQVLEQLSEKVALELPTGITARQAGRLLRRRAMEMAYRGIQQQQIEERLAEMRSGSEEEAKRQLKTFFILNRASEKLEVEVQEQEINGRIAMIAMQQGRRPEKLRQDMARRGELEALYLQIREQKTLDRILEQAKVTETDETAQDTETT